MDTWWAMVLALVPSVGMGVIFYKIMKALLEGDRNERLAHARWEAEQDVTSPPSLADPPVGVTGQQVSRD